MISKRLKLLSGPAALILMVVPGFVECGGKMPGGGNMPSVPQVPGAPALPGGSAAKCPDMKADAVAAFDWASEFKLDASAAGKLKGGLTAAISLETLSAEIDGDLKTACSGLAADLGSKGDYKNGHEACEAAMKAMGDVRAKLGAKAKVTLDIHPPHCAASMNAMADCVGHCDASIQGGKAEVKCEGGEISGTCDAKCQGRCDLTAAAKCDGTCEGSCDAKFSGTCSGTCEGKCDGKDTKGSCAGKCDGKCEGNGKGSCGGSCSGSCQLKVAGECKGSCSGKCSVEIKEPKCSGEVKPPKASADCKASCDAKVSANVECSPARVGLRVEGAADATLASNYKAAIEKHLPLVLKIAIGMKDRATMVAGNAQVAVEGAEAAVKGSASAGPMVAAQLTSCVAAPFKAAADASGSIKANVNVSVEVKAKASASGSASAKS